MCPFYGVSLSLGLFRLLSRAFSARTIISVCSLGDESPSTAIIVGSMTDDNCLKQYTRFVSFRVPVRKIVLFVATLSDSVFELLKHTYCSFVVTAALLLESQ